MINLKTIINFGMLAVVFVFFPSENWEYWFNEGKGDRFAEFCFKGDQRCYVVAKNLLAKPVHLGFSGATAAWVNAIGTTAVERLKPGEPVPSNSYSLVELPSGMYKESIAHSVDPGDSFTPKRLILVAPIEEDRWIFFVLAVVLASSLLTYSIGGLLREDERQRKETRVDYSWHYQQ